MDIIETGFTPDPNFKKFDIPLKMGIILATILCLGTVVSYMFVLKYSFLGFFGFNIFLFIVGIVFYVVTGKRQRKGMGGYISIRSAFQAIFVVILISTVISAVWGIVYAKWIDPESVVRMKESTMRFMESLKLPQEQLDKSAADMDKRLEGSFSIGKVLMGIAGSLIFNSIVGFICAAVLKREPPIYEG